MAKSTPNGAWVASVLAQVGLARTWARAPAVLLQQRWTGVARSPPCSPAAFYRTHPASAWRSGIGPDRRL